MLNNNNPFHVYIALVYYLVDFGLAEAQQAEIAIVLPSATSRVSEGDVQYARSGREKIHKDA